MTLEDFCNRLKKIDGYLCPEPGNEWSVCALDNTSEAHIFTGWGKTPTLALIDAENQYERWASTL